MRSGRRSTLVVSCEHAGNVVPARYGALFRGRKKLLASHRGWDPGAHELARLVARHLEAPLVVSTTTRLLVDLNRSLRHPSLFSEVTRDAPVEEKERILGKHYHPHRERLHALLDERVERGERVVHLGVHTFTPVLDGEVRRADIGLLYDPARPLERELCARWRDRLVVALPELVVLRNSPYRGAADGLTTALRRRYPPARYLGIELEVSHRHALGPKAAWRALQLGVAATLGAVL